MKLSSSDSGSVSTSSSVKKPINFIKRNKMNVILNSKKKSINMLNKCNSGSRIDENYYKRKKPINSSIYLPKSLQNTNEKIIASGSYRQDKYREKSLHSKLKSSLLDIRKVKSLSNNEGIVLDPKTWSMGSNVEPLKLSQAGYTIEKYPKKIGSYGMIFNAIKNDNGYQFIVKMINKNALIEKNISSKILFGLSLQMSISNINILHIECYMEEDEHLYIVMENAINGSLRNIIKLNPGTLSFQQIACYVIQIAQILDYLHKNRIAHLGISSGNILLSKQESDLNGLHRFGVVKLSNFTYAIRNENPQTGEMSEDVEYLAPEAIGNSEFCVYRADIWSFGIVVFELLTGRYPFNQYASKENLCMQIINEDIKIPVSTPLPQEWIDLLLSMCKKDPNERMDIEQIANNNWLNKLINYS